MKREVKSVRKEKHLLGDAFVLLFCRWLRKVLVKICGAFHYPGFYSLRFVPFFLLCLFIVPAQAADDLAAQIAARIEQHPVLRASFEQEKQMAALKRPLLTAGKLTLSRQHGVLWQIERPYRMSYVLAETRIVEIDAAGQRRERGGKEVPGLAQVGRVFRAMLGGKLSEASAEIQANQDDLGRILGMTRSSLRRSLNVLVAERTIATGYGRITILDRHRLTTLCDEA